MHYVSIFTQKKYFPEKGVKKLEVTGYKIDGDDGGHTIYEKNGSHPVQVPRHREINELTAKSILKAAGLK